MIYIPRYKELIADTPMSMGGRFKGEYRCKLRGPDGRIKYETDWSDNLLTNYGLWLLTYPAQSFDTFGALAVGTSNTPALITQTALQGTQLSLAQGYSNISGVNLGPPSYARVTVRDYQFNQGIATGTIAEIGTTNDGNNNPCNVSTRHVLNVPIVKGAQDQLNIEHRLTWYPQLDDAVGVISISGVDYNYTMRHTQIDAVPAAGAHCASLAPHFWAQHYKLMLGDLSANTTTPGDAGTAVQANGGYGANAQSHYQNPWPNTPNWCDCTLTWTIDSYAGSQGPQAVNMLHFPMHLGTPFPNGTDIAIQTKFTKVSDGSNLIKLNTHELVLVVRTYSERYVP